MLTLSQWLTSVMPTLLAKTVSRIDGIVVEGNVSAYWAGTVIRIDLKVA